MTTLLKYGAEWEINLFADGWYVDIELADPHRGIVATPLQHLAHQLGWRPLECKRGAPSQGDASGVDQMMMKVADHGEVPRRVASAAAAKTNVVELEILASPTTGIAALPTVAFQHEESGVVGEMLVDTEGELREVVESLVEQSVDDSTIS